MLRDQFALDEAAKDCFLQRRNEDRGEKRHEESRDSIWPWVKCDETQSAHREIESDHRLGGDKREEVAETNLLPGVDVPAARVARNGMRDQKSPSAATAETSRARSMARWNGTETTGSRAK